MLTDCLCVTTLGGERAGGAGAAGAGAPGAAAAPGWLASRSTCSAKSLLTLLLEHERRHRSNFFS